MSVGSVLSQEAFDAGFDEVTWTYLHGEFSGAVAE